MAEYASAYLLQFIEKRVKIRSLGFTEPEKAYIIGSYKLSDDGNGMEIAPQAIRKMV